MILTAAFPSADHARGLSLEHYRALVAAVDRSGIDAALFVRSPGANAPMLDAVPAIAALASVPAGIGLGASIPIDYTEPFHLARAFAAIDRLTRGRSAVVIDLAAGADLAAATGRGMPGADRYDRALEFFQATTKLWDSWEDDAILVDRAEGLFTDANKIHRINHDGTHYAIRGPLNAPRPIQGWPVIFVPVIADESHALAAQIADVVMVGGSTESALRARCSDIRKKAAAYGHDSVRIVADVMAVLGPAMADAERKTSGPATKCPALHFVGTPRQLAASLRAWRDKTACDGFNFLVSGGSEEIELLGACVTSLGRMPPPDGGTLRERLNLPRPLSRYAA
jgi:alkanesulfonate monooxygenase SsuD/methylene tetrahydromethanopterin reductase-like flavin-dependent oxidoreductase (luciferase family)